MMNTARTASGAVDRGLSLSHISHQELPCRHSGECRNPEEDFPDCIRRFSDWMLAFASMHALECCNPGTDCGVLDSYKNCIGARSSYLVTGSFDTSRTDRLTTGWPGRGLVWINTVRRSVKSTP